MMFHMAEVAIGAAAEQAVGPTIIREADGVPAGRVQRVDLDGYRALDPERAHLAKRLLRWLERSTVREYVSPKGYRMLIVDRHDGK